MTIERASEVLQIFINTSSECRGFTEDTVTLETSKYELSKICEAMVVALEALEYQKKIPVIGEYSEDKTMWFDYRCPRCGERILQYHNTRCLECGQALRWPDDETEDVRHA